MHNPQDNLRAPDARLSIPYSLLHDMQRYIRDSVLVLVPLVKDANMSESSTKDAIALAELGTEVLGEIVAVVVFERLRLDSHGV